MNNNSLLVSSADLLILFLYGGALSYTSSFIMPIDMTSQLIASGLLAFILGCFGPSLDEMFEWILFFSLGVFIAKLVPQIQEYSNSGNYSLGQIILTCKQTFPYCLQLLTPWAVAIPLGLSFYKVTAHQYYKHARFF